MARFARPVFPNSPHHQHGVYSMDSIADDQYPFTCLPLMAE